MTTLTLKPAYKLTQDQALAGMLAGDLMTIPLLCKSVERWAVDEHCFWDQGAEDSFLFMGLPSHVLEFGGCQHILINPKEFDAFMVSICSGDDEDEEEEDA